MKLEGRRFYLAGSWFFVSTSHDSFCCIREDNLTNEKKKKRKEEQKICRAIEKEKYF